MAAARPALYAPGCSHCRSLVFGLFAGHQPQHVPMSRSLAYIRPQAVRPLSIRRFSSLQKPSDPVPSAERSHESPPAAGPEQSADVPWYLQVEPPTHIAPIEPTPLPEVPADAPPFIGTLLEYAAEELGLDALNILDLRKMDPAPALGPNLFMLFGTARSERHLNVSAGRLVRWLRAKHRIHADADGLLGPNERKTKLRRKARRAKLLGTMGTDEADDGIRTGWICVNLGTVNRGGAEVPVVAEDGRLSGFGLTQSGTTIVVQIMTESRRAEMDLESLWTDALERSISGPPAPAAPASSTTAQDKKLKGGNKPKRDLHPVEQTMLAQLHRPSPLPDSRKVRSQGTSPSLQVRFYTAWPQQQGAVHLPEVDPLCLSSRRELQQVLRNEPRQKYRVLELLRTYLDKMEPQEAFESLNKRRPGSLSPPFLELMELAMQTLPPHRTWEYRLALQYKMCVSGLHNARSLETVQYLTKELRFYGIQATREQYLQLLTCILRSEQKGEWPDTSLALDLIATLHQRNQIVLASDVVVTLIEGLGKEEQPWATTLLGQLEPLLYQPNAPCMDERLLMRLMTLFAEKDHWAAVWRAWRHLPRYLRRRSPDMYAHMFRTATGTGSQSLCASVLRRCVPEMMSEEPAVLPAGPVRQTLFECIDVADPDARNRARDIGKHIEQYEPWMIKGEFVRLALRVMSTEGQPTDI
ncbi:hypothetical protein F5Y17DRAFT_442730 [Xylariaceae sp. FL0594]|nr:hypothetical protein F5Y17DRAFT_442730 [Xylariaceae sp. FL0594]